MRFSAKNFPKLHAGNHRDTSPADGQYNCIAWAVGRNNEWWDSAPAAPDKNYYWPANVPRDYKVASLILALGSVGFVPCADGSREQGMEKVAIYADAGEYMHAALQLESGKMGHGEDIEHDTPEALAGPIFGQVAKFVKRQRWLKSFRFAYLFPLGRRGYAAR